MNIYTINLNVSLFDSHYGYCFVPITVSDISLRRQYFGIFLSLLEGINIPLESAVSLLVFGHSNNVFMKENTLITDNGSRPRSLAITDFNNDSHMDIDVENSDTNNIDILRSQVKKTFSTGPHSSPYSIAVGDLDMTMILLKIKLPIQLVLNHSL